MIILRPRCGRTRRSDAAHHLGQRAVNWKPGFPPDNAEWVDNEWTDPKTGKVWKRMTLSEFMRQEQERDK